VPVVERRYQLQEPSCEQALIFLLQSPVKKAARPGGPEDARKDDQDVRTYSNCT
jgi:hypothetical protein